MEQSPPFITSSIRVVIIALVGTVFHSLAAYFPITINSEWTIYEQITVPGIVLYFISLVTPIVGIILLKRSLLFRLLTFFPIVVSFIGVFIIGFMCLVGGHTPFVGFYGFLVSAVLFFAANIFYKYPHTPKYGKTISKKDTLIRTSKYTSVDKVVFCPHCKGIIEKTDIICNHCGKEIES